MQSARDVEALRYRLQVTLAEAKRAAEAGGEPALALEAAKLRAVVDAIAIPATDADHPIIRRTLESLEPDVLAFAEAARLGRGTRDGASQWPWLAAAASPPIAFVGLLFLAIDRRRRARCEAHTRLASG